MKITNNLGLPQLFMKIAEADEHRKADISVTELTKPTQMVMLEATHETEQDVSDMIKSMLGKGFHKLTEIADPEGAERYLEIPVNGVILSGTIDRHKPKEGLIEDLKVTTVAATKMGAKLEWEQQLNVYNYMCMRLGEKPATRLHIIAVLTDWSKTKSKLQSDYPMSPVLVIPLRVWSYDEARNWVEYQVKEKMGAIRTGITQKCSEEERWATTTEYAVIKIGGKRATAVFVDADAADRACKEKGAGYMVEVRPGENRRCNGYCPVVGVCQQYKDMNNFNVTTNEVDL